MAHEPGEFDLIDRYFRSLGAKRSDVVVAIGDDAAVVVPQRSHALCLASALGAVEDDACALATRLVNEALASIAGDGGEPTWATLAMSLDTADATWLEQFACALHRQLDAAGIALIGGDTTSGTNLVVLQLFGFRAEAQ